MKANIMTTNDAFNPPYDILKFDSETTIKERKKQQQQQQQRRYTGNAGE